MVRIIFDKYVHEGYGAQRIASYLNNQGYRPGRERNGTTPASGVSFAITYTGVLRGAAIAVPPSSPICRLSRRSCSRPPKIRTARANSAEEERTVPLNTRGSALLAGNIFCGHCGSRLS